MNKITLVIILMVMNSALFAQNKDAEAVKALNRAWIHCYITRDTATLAQIFADDMLLTSPNGTRFTKQQMLHKLLTGPETNSAGVDTADVRLFGNIAIINSVASFVINDNGKQTPGKTNYMDVYEKRNGRWVAVAAHVTLVQ